MNFDPVTIAVCVVSALLIGMAKGGLAGGLGMVVVPLLSLVMDPRAAAALTLPVLIISDWFAIAAFWKKQDNGHLKVLLIGAVIGIAIGTMTFRYVSEPMMRLLLGLLSIGYVLSRFVGLGRVAETPQGPETGPGIFWGAMAGFTSFTVHAGGPPFQVYMLPKALPKLTFQATNAVFFTTINLIKVPPYIGLGQFNKPILLMATALLPAAGLGVYLGYKLQDKIPERAFYKLMNGLMFVTGLKLTYDGLKALF